MIDRRRLLGSYQSMFVYITMMDRHRLLRGLSRALEFRPLFFMIDRLAYWGGYEGIFISITMMDRHRLLGCYLGL